MLYKCFFFLMGFAVLEIAAVPVDMFPPEGQVRTHTERLYGTAGASSGDSVVQLQNGMSLFDLVEAVSEINGEVYVVDSSVKPSEIKIVTPEGGLTRDDLTELFVTILRVNGLAVIETEGVNKIVNSGDAIHSATPVKSGPVD
ncbi:MAG: hypothetical protein KC473_04585 [Candidatus Dadabacteria bacterium]|nr:hypothetical protein [Candidatus Dadabacteria bacterium]